MAVDLARIEATLSKLTEAMENALRRSPDGTPPAEQAGTAPHSADQAKPDRFAVALSWTYAMTRRDRVFGSDLFSDAAWYMLLHLYVARYRGSDLGVSALCYASGAPMTTALRYLATLAHRDLIERHPDPFDKRRGIVRLSQAGVDKVERALDLAVDYVDQRAGSARQRS